MENYKVSLESNFRRCPKDSISSNGYKDPHDSLFLDTIVMDFLLNGPTASKEEQEQILAGIADCSSGCDIPPSSHFLLPSFLGQLPALVIPEIPCTLCVITALTNAACFRFDLVISIITPEFFETLANVLVSFDDISQKLPKIPIDVVTQFGYTILHEGNLDISFKQAFIPLIEPIIDRLQPYSHFYFALFIAELVDSIALADFPLLLRLFPQNVLEIIPELIVAIQKGLSLEIEFFQESVGSNWLETLFFPLFTSNHHNFRIFSSCLEVISLTAPHLESQKALALFASISPRLSHIIAPSFVFKASIHTISTFLTHFGDKDASIGIIAASLLCRYLSPTPISENLGMDPQLHSREENFSEKNEEIENDGNEDEDEDEEKEVSGAMKEALVELTLSCYEAEVGELAAIVEGLKKGAEMGWDGCIERILEIAQGAKEEHNGELLFNLREWAEEMCDEQEDNQAFDALLDICTPWDD